MVGALGDTCILYFINVPLSLPWLNPHCSTGTWGGIGTFHWAFPKSVEVRLGECFGRMLTSLGMNELELNTWSSYVGELLSVAGSILCHEVGM